MQSKVHIQILPYRIVDKKFEFLLTLSGRSFSSVDVDFLYEQLLISQSKVTLVYLGIVDINDIEYQLTGVDLTDKIIDLKDQYFWTTNILNSPDPLVYTCYIRLKAKLKEIELNQNN